MPDKPTTSFIICTYNRADYLRDTLHSLLHTKADPEQFELLVIDNNSSDKTLDIVNTIGRQNSEIKIRYIKESKQGLSFARNRGIKEASTPNLVFLDDDITAPPSLLPAWISFFEKYPDAVAAGGKNQVQFDDPRPAWMSHFLLPLLAYHDLGTSMKKYPANKYPFGCNMGFKKSIFYEVGLFDTDLGRSGKALKAGEEKELFKRIRDLDKEIYYLPQAFLYHRAASERLNVAYIHKQALGLGQSKALQLKNATSMEKADQWISEFVKLMATLVLCIGYSLGMQFAKAKMLIKFRWWIWQGAQDSISSV